MLKDDNKEISESLQANSSLAPVARNLVDAVWIDRPPRPENPVIVHPLEFAGRSVNDKVADIRGMLKSGKDKAHGVILNMLDEVAWLFNLRGSDIPYNPVFFGYGIVTLDDATLFVDSVKVNDDIYKHLGKSVAVRPYGDIISACQDLGNSLTESNRKVDESNTPCLDDG